MTTTTATIDGAKTELELGAPYSVRYGKDDRVLRSVILDQRAPNGDLLFLDPRAETPKPTRVRPSTIDSIVREDAPEDAIARALASRTVLADELARQAEVDALVESVVADGDRDPDSVAATVEAELRNRAESLSPKRDGESWSAYLARLEQPIPKGLGAAYTRWLETGPGQDALAAAAAEAKAARKVSTGSQSTDAVIDRFARRTKAARAGDERARELLGDAAEEVAPKRGAKPYAERNQVWRCGTCKRRTRVPVCTGPAGATHDPVSAPAGKRRESRS